MKKILCVYIFLLAAVLTTAQTQLGVVKTRGRMVNGVLQPGRGLAGTTVQVAGRQAVISQGTGGNFSFPVTGQKYRVENVQKKGYQLVDYGVCTEYKYSENPLWLVMETPEQQQADLLAKERTLRRSLQRKLQEREDEVEALNVSLEEKNRLLQEINQQREENEKIIKDLAAYYVTLDYDQLDEFQRRVSDCLENGELERADSLLRSRGDMRTRIAAVKAEQAAEAREEEELAQRQQDLKTSKTGTQKRLEDIAADCYNFYQRFRQIHQRDSAAYYLELRAELDSTNVKWAKDVGYFWLSEADSTNAFDKALYYFHRMLRQSLQQFGEYNKWTATAYDYIGFVYSLLHTHNDKALEYLSKALTIRENILGTEHPDVAHSYHDIALIYVRYSDYPKAFEYFNKALAILEKEYGEDPHYYLLKFPTF